jgi:hypothetical protein
MQRREYKYLVYLMTQWIRVEALAQIRQLVYTKSGNKARFAEKYSFTHSLPISHSLASLVQNLTANGCGAAHEMGNESVVIERGFVYEN